MSVASGSMSRMRFGSLDTGSLAVDAALGRCCYF